LPKQEKTEMWQVMSDAVRHYCNLSSDIYGHLMYTI